MQSLSVAATLGWMAVIMVFLGSSDPPGPDLRAWWFPIMGHLFLFGVLGFLVSVSGLMAAGLNRLPSNLAMAAVVGSGWGGFTELYQNTIPGRGAALDDWLVDVAGSVLGGVLAWGILLWISPIAPVASAGPVRHSETTGDPRGDELQELR
jgi:VanZ family protein